MRMDRQEMFYTVLPKGLNRKIAFFSVCLSALVAGEIFQKNCSIDQLFFFFRQMFYGAETMKTHYLGKMDK